MKTTRIQLGMEWVRGPLKFQLMMTTVTRMETVFMMKVKSKYLAMRGKTREVGGRIFETSNRKTTRESKMLIPKVTFSPASADWGEKRFVELSHFKAHDFCNQVT